MQPVDASKGKHCFDDSEIEPGDDVIIHTSLSWNWCRTTNEAAVVRTSGLLLQNAVYRVRSPIAIGEPDELTLRAADSTLVLVNGKLCVKWMFYANRKFWTMVVQMIFHPRLRLWTSIEMIIFVALCPQCKDWFHQWVLGSTSSTVVDDTGAR